MAETKICAKCNLELPISNFYFRKEYGKYKSCCKKCKSLVSKEDIINRVNSATKICTHCNVEKPIQDYHRAGNGKWTQPYCKSCDSIRKKEWRLQNIDHVKQRNKNRYLANRKLVDPKQKEINKLIGIEKRILTNKKKAANMIFLSPEEKKKRKSESDKRYRINNKERIKEQRRKNIEMNRKWAKDHQARKMLDPFYRLKKNFRSRIRVALKGIIKKSEHTEEILGCSIEDFKKYIESQFKDGMSWGNYGKNGWHIDHKIPVSWFNLSNPNCLKLAFNYKNHQPLFSKDNLVKGNKFHHKIY